jgi:hypothetical protein
MDLSDTYRIFYPTASEYTSFSAAHRSFSKVDHILGHKASLNKYNKIEIIYSTLSHYYGTKLEININRNYRKYLNT